MAIWTASDGWNCRSSRSGFTTNLLSALARKTISLRTLQRSLRADVRKRSSWPRPNELVAAFRSLRLKPTSENQWTWVRGKVALGSAPSAAAVCA